MPAAGNMSVTEVSASGQHLDLDLQDSNGKDRLQIGTYTGQMVEDTVVHVSAKENWLLGGG